MDQKNLNSQELRKFVNINKLRDAQSIIRFDALVNIDTATNTLENEQIEILISFANTPGYGQITFLTGNLDPYQYPTVLKVEYQKMNCKSDHLLITDNHTSNPKIGEYQIQIFPIID
tara:strand:- start:12159 stop:12509 length:351 start_codon:yes stop_codon:yes gene_type:complete